MRLKSIKLVNRERTMTPTEQRIAIAEACGKLGSWKRTGAKCPDGRAQWTNGQNNWHESFMLSEIPDYDRNAMHEAVGSLSAIQKLEFVRQLKLIVWGNDQSKSHDSIRLVNATASQRAEAFLKTLGKWKA